MNKTTPDLALQALHPPTSCHVPTGTLLLWKLHSDGLPSPYIIWSELKETHKNNYCGLGSQRHCAGPRECWSAVLYGCCQARVSLDLWDRKQICFISFTSVKVATVIRININAVCATAGIVVKHEVVRNGFDWPNKLQDGYVTTSGL